MRRKKEKKIMVVEIFRINYEKNIVLRELFTIWHNNRRKYRNSTHKGVGTKG